MQTGWPVSRPAGIVQSGCCQSTGPISALIAACAEIAPVTDNVRRFYCAAGLAAGFKGLNHYMFVDRDTGARHYFEVPLARAWEIYQQAMQQVSGLARTARGPSRSASPGKVEIQGVTEIAGEKVFVLRFIQGRNPDWVQRPFFAKFDPQATWLDQLVPAFGEEKWFWQDEYEAIREEKLAV